MNKGFTHEVLSDRLIRIKEATDVFSYLVIGSDRACLLDSGYGVGNIKEYAESLCGKPIFLILTHGHEDHCGGAALFDEAYLSPKDYDLYKCCGRKDIRLSYLHAEGYSDICESELVPKRETPFLELNDGQRFDLGGLHLEAIAVPGHTAGMTMILIEEERNILFGDGCGNMTLIYNDYSVEISTYLGALRKLKTMESRYDRVYRNHTNGISSKAILDEVINCCHQILEKKDAHMPIEIEGEKLYSAKVVDLSNHPADGSEGNVVYREDKAR